MFRFLSQLGNFMKLTSVGATLPHGQIWLMKTHGMSEFPQKDDSIVHASFSERD